MSDPVLLAIIGGIVTVIQSGLTVWSGKKTRAKVKDEAVAVSKGVVAVAAKVDGVHTLVNDRSTKQETKIEAQTQLITAQTTTIDGLKGRVERLGGVTDLPIPRTEVTKEPEVK